MDSENTEQFLNKLRELGDKSIDVFSLTHNKKIKCKPISFKQQKEIISTITSGYMSSTKFSKVINDIIITNTGDDTLLISDKISLILSMRIESLGPMLKIDGVDVDISSCLDKLRKSPKAKKTPILKGDGVELHLQIPTIKEETKIITALIDALAKNGGSDSAKNVISIYIYELTKYVNKVVFGEFTIIFNDLSISDRINIIDNLPISLNQQISKFIQSIKEFESDALEVEVDGDIKSFSVDVSLFND